MVRHNLSLRQAALDAGEILTVDEAEKLSRSREFQRVLWAERQKFWKELASDPSRGKATIIGRMEHAIAKLLEAGEWDKAIEGLIKLAKVEGLLGTDASINIWGTASAKDIEEVKKQLRSIYVREQRTTDDGGAEQARLN